MLTRPREIPLERARSDYRKLRSEWPWPTPRGHSLPIESLRLNGLVGVNMPEWYNPVVELYETWRGATATAAYGAHLRGDKATAGALLELIRESYSSRLRESAIEDPDQRYIDDAITPALRRGDYTILLLTDIQPYLSVEQFAKAASAAGDL